MLFSTVAFAQSSKVKATVGAKGAIGGNYLSTPDNTIPGTVGIFDDGAGGIGGGGGIFGDIRFLKEHLGLEVDILFDGNKTWCNLNDADFILKYTSLRIPLLLKGSVLSGITRISAGIGPEFRFGLKADTDVEAPNANAAELATVKSMFLSSKRNDVALAWEFALGFMVKRIEITLDLRFSYNLTLPKDYLDRVNLNASRNEMDVEAGHTVDGRLLLGIGYVFSAPQ